MNDSSYVACRMGWHRKIYSANMGVEIRSAEDYLATLPAFFKKHYPEWSLKGEEHFFHASPKGNGGTAYLLLERA